MGKGGTRRGPASWGIERAQAAVSLPQLPTLALSYYSVSATARPPPLRAAVSRQAISKARYTARNAGRRVKTTHRVHGPSTSLTVILVRNSSSQGSTQPPPPPPPPWPRTATDGQTNEGRPRRPSHSPPAQRCRLVHRQIAACFSGDRFGGRVG